MSGEVSPYNPAAVRGLSGIWNEASLPVMAWEAAQHRVVLPESLQLATAIHAPVLRWDAEKREVVLAKHPRDRVVAENLSRYLNEWKFVGDEQDHPGHWRVLLQDEDARWYAVTIGPLAGSTNVVTLIGSRRSGFVDNRLRGMKNVKER